MADSQADNSAKSSIVMKVDGPSENSENTAKQEENEQPLKDARTENSFTVENSIGHQICSPQTLRPVIALSKLNSVSSTTSMIANNQNASGASSKSVLRPPQLGLTQNKPFLLNPSKLFVKPIDDVSNSKKENSSNGETPKFVPLVTAKEKADNSVTTSTNNQTTTVVTTNNAADANHAKSQSFVFGQNLQDRVLNDGGTNGEECTAGKPSTSFLNNPTTNGTSSKDEMLFSSAVKETVSSTENCTPSKSLNESAREIEEQRNNKRKYEEVEVKTGEEDETNVLQISCKLFAFDKNISNWQERGRGNLRLNDKLIRDETDGTTYTQSRLVFRTAGVLKVILNTKIWAEMTVEQASVKSVRFTAIDSSGEIKVFLAMANAEDSKQLFADLRDRVSNEIKRQRVKKLVTESDVEENNWTVDSTTTTSADDKPV